MGGGVGGCCKDAGKDFRGDLVCLGLCETGSAAGKFFMHGVGGFDQAGPDGFWELIKGGFRRALQPEDVIHFRSIVRYQGVDG